MNYNPPVTIKKFSKLPESIHASVILHLRQNHVISALVLGPKMFCNKFKCCFDSIKLFISYSSNSVLSSHFLHSLMHLFLAPFSHPQTADLNLDIWYQAVALAKAIFICFFRSFSNSTLNNFKAAGSLK